MISATCILFVAIIAFPKMVNHIAEICAGKNIVFSFYEINLICSLRKSLLFSTVKLDHLTISDSMSHWTSQYTVRGLKPQETTKKTKNHNGMANGNGTTTHIQTKTPRRNKVPRGHPHHQRQGPPMSRGYHGYPGLSKLCSRRQ